VRKDLCFYCIFKTNLSG